jgi:translation initiation factor IF-1
MGKEDLIRLTGIVEDVMPNAMFRIKVNDTHTITATISGRLRQNNIRILLGDSVEVEMSPYDLTRGRVVYRNK